MTTPRRTPTPQEQAKLDAIKRQWQQRRAITQNLSQIKNNIHFCTVINTGHNIYMERPDTVAMLTKTLQSGKPIPKQV